MAKSARNKKAFTKAESPCDKWWVCVRENHLFGDLLPMKDALHILKAEGNNSSQSVSKPFKKVSRYKLQHMASEARAMNIDYCEKFWESENSNETFFIQFLNTLQQQLRCSNCLSCEVKTTWEPWLLRDIMHNSCIMSFGRVYSSWTISLLIVCWPLSKAAEWCIVVLSFVWLVCPAIQRVSFPIYTSFPHQTFSI